MSHSTDHSGASHGSVKTYMTGFILSIILTVIPFWMVMTGAASPAVILGTILAMAVVQVSRRGLTNTNRTRIMCLSLFWHFLDVVWICVFSVVYLMGAM